MEEQCEDCHPLLCSVFFKCGELFASATYGELKDRQDAFNRLYAFEEGWRNQCPT